MTLPTMADLDRALEPYLKEMFWRPIESAPKDGTAVLVAIEGDIGIGIHVAAFRGSGEVTPPDPTWRIMWDHTAMDGEVIDPPTHWMPLPDPPKEKGDAREDAALVNPRAGRKGAKLRKDGR